MKLTIGTGIGGGGMINGKLIHGLLHPEMGHIRIPHDWEKDPFPACVHITMIVLKDWLLERPFTADGGSLQRGCLTGIRLGI